MSKLNALFLHLLDYCRSLEQVERLARDINISQKYLKSTIFTHVACLRSSYQFYKYLKVPTPCQLEPTKETAGRFQHPIIPYGEVRFAPTYEDIHIRLYPPFEIFLYGRFTKQNKSRKHSDFPGRPV